MVGLSHLEFSLRGATAAVGVVGATVNKLLSCHASIVALILTYCVGLRPPEDSRIGKSEIIIPVF